ncbi:hypothetical protein [Halomarina oriensis]|uniref:Uncharacterized protein n=1 Tax=Halomarina oriensis TaxID=671145 RepID=A0A6B0GSD9_9EURY|nr:hypothetical protein [Halomarina oriensis]MWG35015.1 hypothetical protein [Halomarina oriensis]
MEHLTDVVVERFATNPLVTPESDDRIGANVDGPSVVGIPDWVADPLGRYYCYFAHHESTHQTRVRGRPARPVAGLHARHAAPRRGPVRGSRRLAGRARQPRRTAIQALLLRLPGGKQETDVAVSDDGLEFAPLDRILGETYFQG